MGALLAKENIWYVGTQDPNLRVFDIIMHSDWGTSYNAYLVKGSEKTALFETSKLEFFDEFLANVREVCDPASIDYIVVDHTEPDHSGSLEKLLALAPNATVLGSATALNFLKQIVNHEFACRAVTEKDTVDLGGMTLHFLSVPFLHWPDSMYTYIPEAKALFTCDSFGCHYADSRVFNDLIEGDFTPAYKYYFDCIIGPFKRPYMVNALEKIKGLDIEFVGNGHGPVLRSNVQKYFDLYAQWCQVPVRETKRIAIACVGLWLYAHAGAGHCTGRGQRGLRSAAVRPCHRRQGCRGRRGGRRRRLFAGQPHAGGRCAAPHLRDAAGAEPHHPQREVCGGVRLLRVERRGRAQPCGPHAAAEACAARRGPARAL